MLRQIWNCYRGWAKLARDTQAHAQRWNLVALVLVCAAAVFGATASIVPATWSIWAASAATITSALGAYFGKQLIGAGKEVDWIQARAVAEGIKSECYRYAARCGPYALGSSVDAARLFATRADEIAKQATEKGLVLQDDPVPSSGDKLEPPIPMVKDWYKVSRIENQIEYYKKGRQENQRAADILWWVAIVAGIAAVVFGALGAWAQRYAPWIGTMTTIAASIGAYGLADRRRYLIASYAAMQSSLERILGLDAEAPSNITDLVSTTEDLLESEHKAWLPQMLARQRQVSQPQLKAET
ncbi:MULTISPECIES: DUF4231 domain-containing protein [unclassified Bradyrhizobium]|uniref:DUF4231 domain-containing protein n=1 Tax=unclassified Bradyrhizobium TaxID=2631580 RepID=UPI002916A88B|nr:MULTISPECIES: DUF4231 domain-containing protein [unclassified Bradyrhizobium]